MSTVSASAVDAGDRFAAELRGFGPVGLAAMLLIGLTGNVFVGPMVIVPVGATLALIWVRLSHTPWADIGYVRPRSWIRSAVLGVAFGIGFKFAMKAVVMPLLGADPINQAFHFLTGNRGLLPQAIWAMFVAGFAEETMSRGYLFERLGKLFGSSGLARTAIVLITSAYFGAEHYAMQGVPGVEQATIVGLVFGTIFATTGRIFMLMCAHTAFDLTAVTIIYLNLERDVAHLVFR